MNLLDPPRRTFINFRKAELNYLLTYTEDRFSAEKPPTSCRVHQWAEERGLKLSALKSTVTLFTLQRSEVGT